jgi:two-component system response regulator RegX3
MTKILIVEDEISFSDALAYLLKKESYEVEVAVNGKEAIALFNSFNPD